MYLKYINCVLVLLVVFNCASVAGLWVGFSEGSYPESGRSEPEEEWRQILTPLFFTFSGIHPEHERTTTAKNMGILKYHPTSHKL
jgi:hypothetical protein